MPILNRDFFKNIFLSLVVGIFAGLASTVFLFMLDWATRTRDRGLWVIWFLPLGGVMIGWAYHRFERRNHPLKKIPLVLFSTLLTHFCGGSAGREGTAVQMGSSFSEQVAHWFKLRPEEKKALLLAGAGAGFGSAVGAPWAGVFFGIEKNQFKEVRIVVFFQCLIASWSAWLMTHFLEAPHSVYPAPYFFGFSIAGFLSVGLSAFFFGILGATFSQTVRRLEHWFKNQIPSALIRPLVGGLVLVGLYAWEGSYRYVGLGIPVIQESLVQLGTFRDVFFKFVFTALTLASGFKGGEFIPLVFMGTALGSALSQWLPISSNILAAVGFSAVFGAVSGTPISCTLMAIELFGFSMAPFALLGCFISLKTLKLGTTTTQ